MLRNHTDFGGLIPVILILSEVNNPRLIWTEEQGLGVARSESSSRGRAWSPAWRWQQWALLAALAWHLVRADLLAHDRQRGRLRPELQQLGVLQHWTCLDKLWAYHQRSFQCRIRVPHKGITWRAWWTDEDPWLQLVLWYHGSWWLIPKDAWARGLLIYLIITFIFSAVYIGPRFYRVFNYFSVDLITKQLN